MAPELPCKLPGEIAVSKVHCHILAGKTAMPREKCHRDCLRIVMSKFLTIDWYIDQTIAV